jgi:hypothetical protein
MILIGLFPMVLFNKTMNHAGKYGCTRRLNYLVMVACVGIGGVGVYSGIVDLMRGNI